MNPTISKLYREANLCIDMFGRELKTEIESRENYLFQTYPEYFI